MDITMLIETCDFTCYALLGQSVIDYLLCSKSIFNILQTFEITQKLVESDHRPLRFFLELPAVRKINICNPRLSDKSKNSTFKYVYDRNKLNEFMTLLIVDCFDYFKECILIPGNPRTPTPRRGLKLINTL